MVLSSSQLEAFLCVAQTLNFTKAAELLNITQSALSQRVMNLERELETTLFIRDRAGLRLTEAAHELVRYCRCKNSLEEEFLSRLKGANDGGVIRVGGFSSVMQSVILPCLAPLIGLSDQLKFQMIIDEMGRLPGRLHNGEIDYMILDHRQQREGLERVLLGHERNVLIQRKKYRGPDIYLDHDEDDTVSRDYLRLAGKRGKTIERRYLQNVYGLIDGVRLGMGRAVVPKHLIHSQSDFEAIEPSVVLEIPVYLYFFTQPYYSKLHAKIVEAITSQAAKFLAIGEKGGN